MPAPAHRIAFKGKNNNKPRKTLPTCGEPLAERQLLQKRCLLCRQLLGVRLGRRRRLLGRRQLLQVGFGFGVQCCSAGHKVLRLGVAGRDSRGGWGCAWCAMGSVQSPRGGLQLWARSTPAWLAIPFVPAATTCACPGCKVHGHHRSRPLPSQQPRMRSAAHLHEHAHAPACAHGITLLVHSPHQLLHLDLQAAGCKRGTVKPHPLILLRLQGSCGRVEKACLLRMLPACCGTLPACW